MTIATPDPVGVDDVIDLDRERAQRREARGKPMPVRFGGQQIAELPVELPLDVFEPLKALDVDIALLIRQALDIQQANGEGEQAAAATSLVIDLLVTRPSLPHDVVEAVIEMGKRLLNSEDYPDGFDKFLAQRPSREDVATFAKGVFRRYGVGLGEALPSSASSANGETTSKPTSPTTIKSTSGGSGRTRAKKASSVSGG
jgi:hypothetical protein